MDQTGSPDCEEARQTCFDREGVLSAQIRDAQARLSLLGRPSTTNGFALWETQQSTTVQSGCMGGAHHQLQEAQSVSKAIH